MSTYIIAEMGSCHDGDLDKAKDLVHAAAQAGADAIKVQFWSDADELARRRNAPDYRDIYRKYQMPVEWLPKLAWEATQNALIDFMATTYLPQDVATVAPYVKHFKIASFESDALDLVRAHLPFINKNSWLIISCGMDGGNQSEGDDELEEALSGSEALRVLYCVSAYPAPLEHLRLNHVRLFDGYSDHAAVNCPWSGALAVASSARYGYPFIIEAHLKLAERTDGNNPDWAVSMAPLAFSQYVHNIRLAERMLADGGGPNPAEREMTRYKVRIP